jgi:hypothetical protein
MSGTVHAARDAPTLRAGPLIQSAWLVVVVTMLTGAVLGLLSAYRRPGLIAIPQFISVIQAIGISERVAMTFSFTIPIGAALLLAIIVFVGRREDGMALLFSLGILGVVVYSSGSPGAIRATLPELSALAGVVEVGALLPVVFLPFVFPDGRFRPRWTRFVALGLAGVLVGLPQTATAGRLVASNPDQVPPWLALLTAGAASIWVVSATIGQSIRYRQFATPIERQQMRWVLLGLSVIVIPALLGMLGSRWLPGLWIGWAFVVSASASSALPISAGIAILRYRLYDIDLIINRTLVYGALTVLLGAVYVAGVLGVPQILPLARDNDLLVAGSTLGVAALFSPLRRRVQGFVDRRFYRSRYDAQRTVEIFASRLREQMDLGDLLGGLTSVVRETLQPASVGVWLADSSLPPRERVGAGVARSL